MKKADFKMMLKNAIQGSREALESILKLYEPLINKHCYINGTLDEDLRQYLLIHIAMNIGKFQI